VENNSNLKRGLSFSNGKPLVIDPQTSGKTVRRRQSKSSTIENMEHASVTRMRVNGSQVQFAFGNILP
jgi:hypothetical protein